MVLGKAGAAYRHTSASPTKTAPHLGELRDVVGVGAAFVGLDGGEHLLDDLNDLLKVRDAEGTRDGLVDQRVARGDGKVELVHVQHDVLPKPVEDFKELQEAFVAAVQAVARQELLEERAAHVAVAIAVQGGEDLVGGTGNMTARAACCSAFGRCICRGRGGHGNMQRV